MSFCLKLKKKKTHVAIFSLREGYANSGTVKLANFASPFKFRQVKDFFHKFLRGTT